MADGAVISLAALELERDYLFVFALFQNLSGDLRPGDDWTPVSHIFAVGKHQHLRERRGFARIYIQNIHVDRVTFRDAKLPATSLDNCVSH